MEELQRRIDDAQATFAQLNERKKQGINVKGTMATLQANQVVLDVSNKIDELAGTNLVDQIKRGESLNDISASLNKLSTSLNNLRDRQLSGTRAGRLNTEQIMTGIGNIASNLSRSEAIGRSDARELYNRLGSVGNDILRSISSGRAADSGNASMIMDEIQAGSANARDIMRDIKTGIATGQAIARGDISGVMDAVKAGTALASDSFDRLGTIQSGLNMITARIPDIQNLPSAINNSISDLSDVMRDEMRSNGISPDIIESFINRLDMNNDKQVTATELASASNNKGIMDVLSKMDATTAMMIKNPTFRSQLIERIDRPSIFGPDPLSKYNQVSIVQNGFALDREEANLFNVDFKD